MVTVVPKAIPVTVLLVNDTVPDVDDIAAPNVALNATE